MYEITIKEIEEFNFPDKENVDYQYVLWMCNEIKNMTDSLKAARWIGYVLRMVEELEFWDNGVSRYYIRQDVNNGNDKSINTKFDRTGGNRC